MPTRSWTALLDDAGASGGSFDPLPDGDYTFMIDFCEARAANGGKMVYATKNVVTAGAFRGHVVWHDHVVTPNNPVALKQLFRAMSVIGLPIDYFQSDPSDHQVAAALQGKIFRGQVSVRVRRGQESNEIDQFFSATDRTVSDAEAEPVFHDSTSRTTRGLLPSLDFAPSGPDAPEVQPRVELSAPARDEAPLVVSKRDA